VSARAGSNGRGTNGREVSHSLTRSRRSMGEGSECRVPWTERARTRHGSTDPAVPIAPAPGGGPEPLWVSRNAPHPGPESLGLRRASQASPLVRKEVVVKLGWGTLGFQVLTPTPSSSWLPTTRGDDLGATCCPPACLAPRCDCVPRCQATAAWTFLVRRREAGCPLTHSYQAVAGTCAGRDALVPGSRQPPTPHLQLPPAASPADRDG